MQTTIDSYLFLKQMKEFSSNLYWVNTYICIPPVSNIWRCASVKKIKPIIYLSLTRLAIRVTDFCYSYLGRYYIYGRMVCLLTHLLLHQTLLHANGKTLYQDTPYFLQYNVHLAKTLPKNHSAWRSSIGVG